MHRHNWQTTNVPKTHGNAKDVLVVAVLKD